jgi:hypothetical protein
MYCVKCGKPFEDGSAFCPSCGTPVRPGPASVVAQAAHAPAVAAPPKRGLFSSRRSMTVAIVAIVAVAAVAAVAIAGFTFLGSARLSGKTIVAFAKHYEGTWEDQQGNKAIIDTAGGVARISIISSSDSTPVLSATVTDDNISVVSGSDGTSVFSATIHGDNISVDQVGSSGAQVSLTKNEFTVKDSSGETHTFVRH